MDIMVVVVIIEGIYMRYFEKKTSYAIWTPPTVSGKCLFYNYEGCNLFNKPRAYINCEARVLYRVVFTNKTGDLKIFSVFRINGQYFEY